MKKHLHKSKTRGFTLIEISIVLIIIGLITGGILIGRDMIYNATVRRQVTQIEKFNVATTTFKLKYNCLPGDCANAEGLGLGTLGGPGENGDGDGKIFGFETHGVGLAIPDESINFWYHLSLAGFVDGDYPGYDATTTPYNFMGSDVPAPELTSVSPLPTNAYAHQRGGIVPVSADAWLNDIASRALYGPLKTFFSNISPHYWYMGTTFATAIVMTQPTAPGLFLPSVAYALDAKIDDGMPWSGKTRSLSRSLGVHLSWNPTSTAGSPACVENSRYNITKTNITTGNYTNLLCAVFIQTEF